MFFWYVRLPDLLIDLEIARTDRNYKKVMAKYANPVLLILDEWLDYSGLKRATCPEFESHHSGE